MEFVNSLKDRLTWEWDDRFQAVLSTCGTEHTDDIQSSIKNHLKTIWDDSNTEDAPDTVLDAISHFGGLMPGQVLFTSDPCSDFLLCCAWWPWGDGETVSIRVAPYPNKLSDEDRAVLNGKLRSRFKVNRLLNPSKE